MKNKIAITTAFFAASCLTFAEIALTDSLSVEGFADMSYSRTKDDRAAANQIENSHNLDQVEITFLLDSDVFTAQIDLCLLYTSPSPRDGLLSRMPSSA